MSVITNPINLWGRAASPGARTLEAQRSDLWALNLSSVTTYLFNNIDRFNATGASFNETGPALKTLIPPVGALAVYYPSSVELPEQRVASQSVIRQTTPYAMPAMDEALGSIRVMFLHDVASGSYRGSKIYALMAGWRGLVRAGRGPISGQDFVIPLGVAGSLVPRYAFDVKVELYKGGSTDNGENSTGLELSAAYVIKDMWLQAIQIGQLRYAGGTQVLEITAQFSAADIFPDTSI